MKFFILCAFIAAASAFSLPSFDEWANYDQLDAEILEKQLFNQFKSKYNKIYESDRDESNRLAVFKTNLRRISLLQELEKGTAVYGINEFADLSEQEFSARFNGLKPTAFSPKYYSEPVFDKNAPLPEKVDWRERGAVTDVKNQGSCGSCWAFSATGNIEGINKVATGELVSVSEQELVDCDKKDAGCGGGLMSLAFESLIEMGGIEGESDYPYKGRKDQCKFNKDLVKVKFSSYTNLTQNEEEIAQYVAQHGPVAIGINASMMQFYFGGISHPIKFFCSPNHLNHGVLIVGFGTEKKGDKELPYWIIKNSWGARWGEKGYYRLYRNGGVCGVNKMVSSVVIDKK